MTIKEALLHARQFMDNIEAKILLKYILQKEESYIIANANTQLTKMQENELINCINKITEGYPLQYITNQQYFMGLSFCVDENVLIPQPDTEILVETVIKNITELGIKNKFDLGNMKVLDLCTGSGAIAISIKKYLPEVQVFASDISKNALKIAQKNANNNKVKINFIESNMFENISETFDVITSNPPYIKTDEIRKLSKQVQNEPKLALDGGKDGLDFYKIIAKEGPKHLNKNGVILMEIGYDQGQAVTNLFKNSKCIKDYAGNSRVVVWNRRI